MMGQSGGRRNTTERTAIAGAVFALIAGSASAESLAPAQPQRIASRCMERAPTSDGVAPDCLRINGYVAASVDAPIDAASSHPSLIRPRAGASGNVSAGQDSFFLPTSVDQAR